MVKNNTEINIGIDASRNRSGGAKAHIIGIINEFDEKLGFKNVHLWAYKSLLDEIQDRPWLVKHHHPYLELSLIHQLFWQAFQLKKDAHHFKCNILFSTDASTLCNFSPLVVLSQDLLSYEPGIMKSYKWGKNRLRLEIIKIVQNLAFRRSKGVLFLTDYASKIIQKSCGRLSRTALAPHGIDDKFRNIVKFKPKYLKNSIKNPIKCIYVSNADIYKHHDNVVYAMKLLKNRGLFVNLKLLGGGSGLAQSNLENAIAECDPEGEYIEQLDFIQHDDLPRYLAKSHIYIFASSCENLPVTLLEGMASGLPIVCSNRGPMPEVLKDGGIYFNPEESSSIADAIENLIVSQHLCNKLTTKAKKLSASYTWKACSQNTFKFIRNTYLDEKNSYE